MTAGIFTDTTFCRRSCVPWLRTRGAAKEVVGRLGLDEKGIGNGMLFLLQITTVQGAEEQECCDL